VGHKSGDLLITNWFFLDECAGFTGFEERLGIDPAKEFNQFRD